MHRPEGSRVASSVGAAAFFLSERVRAHPGKFAVDPAIQFSYGKLRFYLFDEADFAKFRTAVTVELSNTEFFGVSEDEQDEAEQAATFVS